MTEEASRKSTTDFRKRIEADENWFEDLVRNIPGFGGYKERENRRTADQILRKQLADDLDRQAKRLEDIKLNLTNQGQLEMLDDFDRFGRQLATFIDSVRYADYGYTGWFDAIKIKEDELDRMYEYDAGVAARVGEITSALDALQSATGEAIAGKLSAVAQLVADLESKWKDREKVMTGMIEEGAQ